MLDSASLTLLFAGAAAGGFINGLAGFGTALFALGFWLQVFEPVEAVALAASLSVLSGVQGLWVVRHSIMARRLGVFVLPAIVGLPLGVAVLQHIDVSWLRILVAILLLSYGIWFSLHTLPRWSNASLWLDGGVGFLGGVLGGVAGLSGALPMMWCTLRAWPKSETRGVLQPFNVTILLLAVCYFAWLGYLDASFLLKLALCFPMTMLAAQVGIALFKRLADDRYWQGLVSMMLLSGAILLWREWSMQFA